MADAGSLEVCSGCDAGDETGEPCSVSFEVIEVAKGCVLSGCCTSGFARYFHDMRGLFMTMSARRGRLWLPNQGRLLGEAVLVVQGAILQVLPTELLCAQSSHIIEDVALNRKLIPRCAIQPQTRNIRMQCTPGHPCVPPVACPQTWLGRPS